MNLVRKTIIGVLLFCGSFPQLLNAQAFLQTPVSGTYGTDFIIVNYVDWAFGNQILDYHCGNKTYDGHQGTDFVIRSFAAMDSGIDVMAAADGVVTFVIDTLFDREKESDLSKGLGNYIALAHDNGYYSYYAHLKKNSATVSVGDPVSAGDVIGQIGSSGNSTDPHLHFELWYDSTFVVDPYAGACGNGTSLWLDELQYDTSFQIWTSSLCDFIPDLDTLREEPPAVSHFNAEVDEAVTYWSIMYGLRMNDSLTLKWYTPEGLEWFRFDYEVPVDYWYFYYYSYIDVPMEQSAGTWQVVLYRNNEPVDSNNFTIQTPTSTARVAGTSDWSIYPNPANEWITISSDDCHSETFDYRIFDLTGKPVISGKSVCNERILLHGLPQGLYTVVVESYRTTSRVVRLKLVVVR